MKPLALTSLASSRAGRATTPAVGSEDLADRLVPALLPVSGRA